MKPTHRIELYQDRTKGWRWRLIRIRGGKVVADSGESYRNKSHALRMISEVVFLTPQSAPVVEA